MTLTQMYIWVNVIWARVYRALVHLPEIFPEFILARVHTWPKLDFPENLFSKIYTCQISHWAEITFSENLFSRIRTCQNFYV